MPSTNVLDEIESLVSAAGAADLLAVSLPRRPGSCDALLIPKKRPWDGDRSDEVRSALSSCPSIQEVGLRRGKSALSIGFCEAWIARVGRALEEGRDSGLDTLDLAAGERIVIDFCNPNATKALHVGHLRNIAIGNALAGLATSCGATTVTHSHVGDIGRSMGEALAGCLLFGGRIGSHPVGTKSDHLVGECYAQYVQLLIDSTADASADDPALTREGAVRHVDLAERLLDRLRKGDPAATDIWLKVRQLATDGHAQTLSRLGVAIDHTFYESDYVQQADAFADSLIEHGIASYTQDGALVYRTGRSEYPLMILRRPDGFPTQHLRFLSLWQAKARSLRGALSMEVIGDEWSPLARFGSEILQRLTLGKPADVHPQRFLTYGMVSLDEAEVSSSSGGGLLADELLDELMQDECVQALATEHNRLDLVDVTGIVALGWFLSRDIRKPMLLRPELLTNPRSNPGWTIAVALATAWHPAFDGSPETPVGDRWYRFAVVHSQMHRRLVALSLARWDPVPLVKFHGHIARWYLEMPPNPSVARCMRTLLGHGVAALGLRFSSDSRKNGANTTF